MRAMVLEAPQTALQLRELPIPEPVDSLAPQWLFLSSGRLLVQEQAHPLYK